MLPIITLDTFPKEIWKEITSWAPTRLSGVSKFFLDLVNSMPVTSFPPTHPVYRRFLARSLFFPSADIGLTTGKKTNGTENKLGRAFKKVKGKLSSQKAKGPMKNTPLLASGELTELGSSIKGLLYSIFRNCIVGCENKIMLNPEASMSVTAQSIFRELQSQCAKLGIDANDPLFVSYVEALLAGFNSYSCSKEINDTFPQSYMHSDYLESQLDALKNGLQLEGLNKSIEAYVNQDITNITKTSYEERLEILKRMCPNIKHSKLAFALKNGLEAKHGTALFLGLNDRN